MISVGRRPMRSDSAPPGVLAADFTTCSAAQRIGASATGTPSWLARSSRNASVELPSVKRKITARTRQNRASSGWLRSGVARLRRRAARHVAHRECDHEHRQHPRDRGQPEHRAELDDVIAQHRERDERPDDAARMIRRAMKAERATADARVHRLGDECVARRVADPLPHAVGHADEQHLDRARRDRDERPHRRRDRVAPEHERLPLAHAVRPPAARQLEQRGRGLGRALDRPDEARVRAEDGRQEDREQRIDHLARDVGEKAHRGERQHVASELGPIRSGHRGNVGTPDEVAGERCAARVADRSSREPVRPVGGLTFGILRQRVGSSHR